MEMEKLSTTLRAEASSRDSGAQGQEGSHVRFFSLHTSEWLHGQLGSGIRLMKKAESP